MATAINKKLIRFREQVARFSEQNIAGRQGLHTMGEFPHDIWQKMGQENLLGIVIPTRYGGLISNQELRVDINPSFSYSSVWVCFL